MGHGYVAAALERGEEVSLPGSAVVLDQKHARPASARRLGEERQEDAILGALHVDLHGVNALQPLLLEETEQRAAPHLDGGADLVGVAGSDRRRADVATVDKQADASVAV